MYDLLARLADAIARIAALAGGIILLAITVLTCVSIIGRALVPLGIGPGPIRGIYDYTEIAIAVAIFAFLPICQLQRGHATVDLFTPYFPGTANRVLDLVMDIAMCAVAVVGAQRLYLGMLDKLGYGETTLIAQVPVWQGYAAALVGAVAFALVAAFCILRSARALLRGETDDPRHV
ncbi:TRAP transporter small permease [Palleronia sp. LCG004]|uniref:TRAP transporter small permease n=1 Tax=Palleronia sp. LCG004 TaxID=3079304 RepID=UPI002941E6A2|nr:TRAP transporter small permease [Palleronia sp. LCG004]WOI55260.1 TRAP transporter small permease [Palleronia sp. LCG004]